MSNAFGIGLVAARVRPRTKAVQSVYLTTGLDDAVPNERYIGHFLTPVFLSS